VKRPARAIATVWSGQPGSNRRVDPRALRIHPARPPGGSRGFARRSMRGGFATLALPECRRFEQASCPGAIAMSRAGVARKPLCRGATRETARTSDCDGLERATGFEPATFSLGS
jgi:hypothetical protein